MSTLPKCMKVLIKEQEKPSYIYKDIPVPLPNTGDLLVKVLKVSLCGSDTVLYEWNEGKATFDRHCRRMIWKFHIMLQLLATYKFGILSLFQYGYVTSYPNYSF